MRDDERLIYPSASLGHELVAQRSSGHDLAAQRRYRTQKDRPVRTASVRCRQGMYAACCFRSLAVWTFFASPPDSHPYIATPFTQALGREMNNSPRQKTRRLVHTNMLNHDRVSHTKMLDYDLLFHTKMSGHGRVFDTKM